MVGNEIVTDSKGEVEEEKSKEPWVNMLKIIE